MEKTGAIAVKIKPNTPWVSFQRYAWTLALLIAIGGQFLPQLGLLVPVIMLILMVMSLFKGKYWCGNYCPHGSLFDNILKPWSKKLMIPRVLRSKTVIFAVLTLFMIMITYRFVYVIHTMEGMNRIAGLGSIFVNIYLMVIILGGLLALLVSPRTWCFACPMGTIQSFFHSLGKQTGIAPKTEQKVTFAQPHKCSFCGKCEKVCPVQLSPYKGISETQTFDDAHCIKCKTCIQHCPSKSLRLSNQEE
jgi:ferredoxin-type protein NapH